MSHFAEKIMSSALDEYEVDWTGDCTQSLLTFLYSGQLQLSSDADITELEQIGKEWSFPELLTACNMWRNSNGTSWQPGVMLSNSDTEHSNNHDAIQISKRKRSARTMKTRKSKRLKLERDSISDEESEKEMNTLVEYSEDSSFSKLDLDNETEKEQQFSCQTCHMTFTDTEDCLSHICKHQSTETGRSDFIKRPSINFKPKYLDDTFVKLMNDRLEKQSYPSFLDTLPKDVLYMCIKCNAIKSDQHSCLNHIQQKHCDKKAENSVEMNTCDLCEDTPIFINKAIFNIHRILFHSLPVRADGVPTYWPALKLPGINKLSKEPIKWGNLKPEKQAKKLKLTGAEAEFAGKCSFSQKSDVLIQMRYMLQKCFPFVCNLCLVRFATADDGFTHARVEHGSMKPKQAMKARGFTAPIMKKSSLTKDKKIIFYSLSNDSPNKQVPIWKEGLQPIRVNKLIESRINSTQLPSTLDILPVGLCFACLVCRRLYEDKEECFEHLVEECTASEILQKSDGGRISVVGGEDEAVNDTSSLYLCSLCGPAVFFGSNECFKIHLLLFHSVPLGKNCALLFNHTHLENEELDNLMAKWPDGRNCPSEQDLQGLPFALDEHTYAFSVHELSIPNVLNTCEERLDRCFLYYCDLCLVRFIDILPTQMHIISEHRIPAYMSAVYLMRRKDSLVGRLASQSKHRTPIQSCIVPGCSYEVRSFINKTDFWRKDYSYSNIRTSR